MSNQNPVNDGGPAFPHGPMGSSYTGEDGYTTHQGNPHPGMTLRTWLAGKALAGILADGVSYDWDVVRMAKASVTLADALIAELEKGGADEKET